MSEPHKELTPTSDHAAFAWLAQTPGDEFDYIVAASCQALNWIECMLSERGEACPQFNCMVTMDGMLMLAEDLADSFTRAGYFPKIALVDTVLVHGRSINAFILRLLDLLDEILQQRGGTFQRESLWAELCGSVTIFACCVNRGSFLLRHELQWSMRLRNICQERGWRRFTAEISNKIWKSDIANTACVISAVQSVQFADVPDRADGWEFVGENEIAYRGTQQRLYAHPISRQYQTFPAVRSYVCGSRRYYTPYFFCGVLGVRQVSTVLECVEPVLRKGKHPDLAKLLDLISRASAYDNRQAVYLQLAHLLLGQITLHCFIRDSRLNSNNFTFDTHKIARNLGLADEAEPMLSALCQVEWPENFLGHLAEQMGLPRLVGENAGINISADMLRAELEHIVYQRAVQHEGYAKKLEKSFLSGHESASIRQTGEISYSGLLMIACDELGIPRGDYRSSLLLTACLTQMLDRGDISLESRAEPAPQGHLQFYSVIRNTNMSLSILPRKLDTQFPDFYRLTHFYWRDDGFPEYAHRYFGGEYEDGGGVDEIGDAAEEYARAIVCNPDIISSLIGWEDVSFGI